MGRNRGRLAVSGRVVDDVVPAVTQRLAGLHPSLDGDVVDAVVHHAATELVSVVDDPVLLARLLDRRAHARLAAMAGSPIPIAAAQPPV
jgi:hypothetical protein